MFYESVTERALSTIVVLITLSLVIVTFGLSLLIIPVYIYVKHKYLFDMGAIRRYRLKNAMPGIVGLLVGLAISVLILSGLTASGIVLGRTIYKKKHEAYKDVQIFEPDPEVYADTTDIKCPNDQPNIRMKPTPPNSLYKPNPGLITNKIENLY